MRFLISEDIFSDSLRLAGTVGTITGLSKGGTTKKKKGDNVDVKLDDTFGTLRSKFYSFH